MPSENPLIVTSAAVVAEFLGCSERSVNVWASSNGLPREPSGGNRYDYDLAAIHRWDLARKMSEVSPAGIVDTGKPIVDDDNADPLLAGADSPYLERYRKQKAIAAELENRVRRGELIERDTFRGLFQGFVEHLRRSGDRLLQVFGEEAVEILDEAFDACELEFLQESPNVDD